MKVDGARCASAQLVTATGIGSTALLGSVFISFIQANRYRSVLLDLRFSCAPHPTESEVAGRNRQTANISSCRPTSAEGEGQQ